jgi:hypothetical protein
LDEKFKSGSYAVICRDVTLGLDEKHRMGEIRVLIKIVDLDEENMKAEEAEANAKNNKGKKK